MQKLKPALNAGNKIKPLIASPSYLKSTNKLVQKKKSELPQLVPMKDVVTEKVAEPMFEISQDT